MIGTKLEALLKAKEIRPGTLATMTGINKSTIYSIIKRNNKNVDYSTMEKIADALNVPVEFFHDGGEDNSGGKSEKSNEFRQAVRFEIEQAGDLDTAIENGLDIAFLDKIAEESGTLSLDDACRAADELGMTVSELLNEKDLRVFSTMDPQVKEIMEKLLDLSEEKREKALDYIRYLSTSPSI